MPTLIPIVFEFEKGISESQLWKLRLSSKEEPDVEMKEEPQEEEQPPVAELDEEAPWLVSLGVARMGSILKRVLRQEQKLWFLPRPVTDMVAPVFNSNLPLFVSNRKRCSIM